jgi:protease I
MANRLKDMKIAVLATDFFEYVELTKPRKAMEEEGAKVTIISPEKKEIQGLNHVEKAEKVQADMSLDEANPDEFDAVFLPGGALNADFLRVNTKAQQFVKRIETTDKPIAAICHGTWLLVSANLVNGRTMTSYHTLQDDIRNAGGRWIDYEVVFDYNWVTSRKPDDIPAFNQALIMLFENYRDLTTEIIEEPEESHL